MPYGLTTPRSGPNTGGDGAPRLLVVLAHPDDQMLWDAVWPDDSLDGALSIDVVLRAGGHELNVLHTPGHSPGCCCFHDAGSGLLFSGDTLFCGGPGATGRSYSDEATILRSIMSQLLILPPETIVHTGHGESTTIGAERDGVSTVDDVNSAFGQVSTTLALVGALKGQSGHYGTQNGADALFPTPAR